MAAQHAVLLLLWCGVCVYGAAAASVVANVSAASAEECDVSKCPPGPCTRAYFWEQRSECVFLNCSDDAACERLIEGLSQSARVQISASPRTSSPPAHPGPPAPPGPTPHSNISTTTSSSTKDLQPQRASSPEPRPSQTTANGRQGQAAPPPIMSHNGTSPNGHPDVKAGDSSPDVKAGDSSPGVKAGDSSPGVKAGDSSPGVQTDVQAGDSSSPGVQTDVQAGDSSSPDVQAGDSSPGVQTDVQAGDSSSPGVKADVQAGDSSSPGVKADVQAGDSSSPGVKAGDSSPEPRPSQTTANGRQGQAAPPPIMTHNGTSPNGHPDVQAGDSSPGVKAGDSSSPGVKAGDSSPGVKAGDSSPGVKAGDSSPGVQTDVQAGDSSSPGVKADDSSSPDVQTGDSSSPGVQTDVQAGTSSPDDLHRAQNTSITPTSPNKAPTAITTATTTAAPTAGTTVKSTTASTRPPRPATTPKPRASTRHATFIPALLSSAPSPGVVQLTLGRDRAAVEAAAGSLTSHVMNTSSLLAALIFGLLFFSVTVALFLRHAYESYKRRDYTQVDYLINGMYSDSGL